MSNAIPGPTSHVYFSQRLRLHYVDWGNEDAPPLLLVHGGRDHCRTWDWVAQAFRQDYHVIAPDLRGHGDSAWVYGSGYTIIDYVYDIAQLIDQKELQPLTIIGHSLGGNVTLQYSGIYPDHVKKLVSVEGWGPPPDFIRKRAGKSPQTRMQEWIDMLREMSGRDVRRYETIDAAVRRMRDANPHLSPDQARHLTIHGTNQNEDGTYTWKFDNYMHVFSPHRFNEEDAHELWDNITCPVLLVRGKESWAPDPEASHLLGHFNDARAITLPDAGHWVHHDQLEPFVDSVRDFIRD
jgi:pimeloyl-ACP methyl ester carboxylesterase